jgi:thiol-disulfide isomerase/thioredoxin
MRNIIFAVMIVLFVGGCDKQKDAGQQGDNLADRSLPTDAQVAGAPAERSSGAGIDRSHSGSAMPDVGIRDPDGETVPLMSVRVAGKPLLVNLWATWCAPCIKELPTLDRLADQLGAPTVVALSQDSGAQAKVSAFLAARKLELEPWQDADMAAAGALGVQILPTTVLYGRDGKEVWRFSGDMDWTGPEAAKLLAEAG